MSRFWLVELEPDLEQLAFPTTRGGVWAGVLMVNGVRSLTDVAAISRETLDALLRPPEPQNEAHGAARRNARRGS